MTPLERVLRNTRMVAYSRELFRIVAEEGPVEEEPTLWRVAPLVPPEMALRERERERLKRQLDRELRGVNTRGRSRVVRREPGYLLQVAQRRVVRARMIAMLKRGLLARDAQGRLVLGDRDPRRRQRSRLAPWTVALVEAVREAGELSYADALAVACAAVPEERARLEHARQVESTRRRRRQQRTPEGVTRVEAGSNPHAGRMVLASNAVETAVAGGWVERVGEKRATTALRWVPWPPR